MGGPLRINWQCSYFDVHVETVKTEQDVAVMQAPNKLLSQIPLA